MAVCNAVKDAIKDEEKGILWYREVSPDFSGLERVLLDSIVRDEEKHVEMLSALAKKLGCTPI